MSHNDHGITLLEILLALGVISVGLIGLLIVVPVAALGVQRGNESSYATYLAQQRIEQARHARWNTAVDCLGASPTADTAPIPTGATCTGSTAATYPDEPFGTIVGAEQYSRTTRITDCATVAGGCSGVVSDTLRLVTVTVGYRPMTGTGVSTVPTNIRLEWLVAQR